MDHSFNVRVYGVLISDAGSILVSDEYIKGSFITKFPGGGLEYGEGILDCLKREWREELGQEIEVGRHLYTTEFFQVSAFGDGRQIISIYYYVKALSPLTVMIKTTPFEFDKLEDQAQSFRWIAPGAFSEDTVTLPIDKVVVRLVNEA
ncbi:MAG TPA: NUDIX domain-containing protein [Chitinophagaceae bacterium]|jgi:ADP-ribose pyrophosphatase YjhB (NUDIX family)|nr:NUDIX domain-containing protein [Chitinophagaceae bacterium]